MSGQEQKPVPAATPKKLAELHSSYKAILNGRASASVKVQPPAAPLVTKQTAEEEFKECLGGHELYWDGTNTMEVVISISGRKVRVVADGRELVETNCTIVSPTVFSFDWPGQEMNTFSVSSDKRTFTRNIRRSGETHDGAIRRKR